MYTFTKKQQAAFAANHRAWEVRQVHWDSQCTCNDDCHMAVIERFYNDRAARLWHKVGVAFDHQSNARYDAHQKRQAAILAAWHRKLDEIIRQA